MRDIIYPGAAKPPRRANDDKIDDKLKVGDLICVPKLIMLKRRVAHIGRRKGVMMVLLKHPADPSPRGERYPLEWLKKWDTFYLERADEHDQK